MFKFKLDARCRVCFLAILLVASILRFYHLETPSMWWDEILVPMTARHSLAYIFEWARSLEVNSPYYILLVKGVLLAGDSDFCLRLLPAVAGVGAVWAMAHVGGRLLGVKVGLWSAFFLAIWPLHVLLSRQVRPYALFSFVLILSLWRLLEFLVDDGHKLRNAALLAILYSLMFSFHYIAAPVILSHCVFVLCCVLFGKRPFVNLAYLFGAALVGFSVVAPFFLGTFLHRPDMMFATKGWLDTFNSLVLVAYHFVTPFVADVPLDYIMPVTFFSYVIGLAVVGCVCCACYLLRKRDPLVFGLVVCSLVVPVAFFVLTKQMIWRPRHLSFLLPPVLLAFSSGFGVVLDRVGSPWKRQIVIILVVTLPIWSYTSVINKQLYESESYPDVYKTQARELGEFVRKGEPVFGASMGDWNALVWYYSIFVKGNALEHQVLSNASDIVLHFIVPENFGTGNKYEIELLEKMGTAKQVEKMAKAKVLSYSWKRESVSPISMNTKTLFSASPWMFYRAVTEFHDVTVKWNDDPLVHPTMNHVQTGFGKEYSFESGSQGIVILGNVKLNSNGEGNTIRGLVSFDAEQPRQLCALEGRSGPRTIPFKIVSTRPPHRIRYSFEMTCDDKTPSYPGSNLDTVGFHELEFSVVPLDQVRWGSLSYLESFTGLDPVEGAPEGRYRWGHGPETVLEFVAGQEEDASLDYDFTSVINDQSVVIEINGVSVKRIETGKTSLGNEPVFRDMLRFRTKRGTNRVVFRFTKYNHSDPSATFAPGDSRPLAVRFNRLMIRNDAPVRDSLFSGSQ